MMGDFNPSNDKKILLYGRRRSLIRMIASILPKWLFRPTPRPFLHQIVTTNPGNSTTRSYDNSLDEFDSISFSSRSSVYEIENDDDPGFWSEQLSFSKPDVVQYSSTPKKSSDEKLIALEKEMKMLREQVALLIESQMKVDDNSKIYKIDQIEECDKYCNKINEQKSTQPEVPYMVLPPPPPPPPPLPPIPQMCSAAPFRVRKAVTTPRTPETQTPVSMRDILKEMNKVKLRPIERSPGGRPLKTQSADYVNSDLQAILKRRYSAMHTVSPSLASKRESRSENLRSIEDSMTDNENNYSFKDDNCT